MPRNKVAIRIDGEELSDRDLDVIRDCIIARAFKDFDFSVIASHSHTVTVEYDDADIAFIEQFHEPRNSNT